EDLRRVPEPGGTTGARPPGRAENGGWVGHAARRHADHRARRHGRQRGIPGGRRLAAVPRARDGDRARAARRGARRACPGAPDRANLSVVVPLDHASPWRRRLETFFTARIRHLPHLARRLAGARIVAPVSAMGPLAYEVGAPRVGGVLLVGDAAGFFDPFTG